MSLRKLSYSDVESLIELWKNERALRDVTFPKYANADERKAALSISLKLSLYVVPFLRYCPGLVVKWITCLNEAGIRCIASIIEAMQRIPASSRQIHMS